MSNEATPESRGGFEIDIVYGEAADRIAIGNEGNAIFDYLFNANVSYLAPITDAGIKITAGRFETHTGTESRRIRSTSTSRAACSTRCSRSTSRA